MICDLPSGRVADHAEGQGRIVHPRRESGLGLQPTERDVPSWSEGT